MERRGKHENEVIERLTRIETKMDALAQDVSAHVKEDNLIFHGDGGDNKGLLIEHAQLMSSVKTWRRVVGASLSALGLAVAERFIR